MDTSIFIARVFALAYLAIGLGMLINPKYYFKLMEEVMLKSAGVLYLGGAMALIAGYLLVTFHNIWEYSWVVVITIFGWLALLKGLMFLIFPKHMEFWRKTLFKKKSLMPLWGFIILIFGLFFGYFGFFA